MVNALTTGASTFEHQLVPIEPNYAATNCQIDLEIVRSLEAAETVWRELEPCCAPTPFQTYDWHRLQQTSAHYEHEAIIIIGRSANGSPLFLLPLALERQGPVQMLIWLASRQASYCGGLFHPDAKKILGNATPDWLIARIAEIVPDADALVLYDQRDDDETNPFRLLPHTGGADEGYSITLSAWEELYSSRGNRRTRHNDRRREKRLTEYAPWHARIVTSVHERRAWMQTMFTQKRRWMHKRGISDYLADEINRSLLMDLASSQPIAFEPVVAALDVAGQTAAVSFGITHGNTHYSLISSIHPDEKFRPFTPGDILFRHVLKFMCDSGVEHFDLGLGTTVPKVQYADHRFRMFHTLMPLTVPGRTLVAALRCQLAVKRLIKETPPLWTLFQRARSMRGAVQGVFGHTSG